MSEPSTGLASSIAKPVGEALQKHNALSPLIRKNANRAHLRARFC